MLGLRAWASHHCLARLSLAKTQASPDTDYNLSWSVVIFQLVGWASLAGRPALTLGTVRNSLVSRSRPHGSWSKQDFGPVPSTRVPGLGRNDPMWVDLNHIGPWPMILLWTCPEGQHLLPPDINNRRQVLHLHDSQRTAGGVGQGQQSRTQAQSWRSGQCGLRSTLYPGYLSSLQVSCPDDGTGAHGEAR